MNLYSRIVRRPHRSIGRGFTLVELLVVIAVIGVLVGLLLAAVQRVREASRRTACSNKLKQIGLALLTHHDTFEVFPSAFTSTSKYPFVAAASRGAPWTVRILPFMEASSVYDGFDMSIGFQGEYVEASTGTNRDKQFLLNPDFRCPSYPDTAALSSNYFGVMGGGASSLASGNNTATPTGYWFENGVLFVNAKTRLKDITDGSSATYLVGEGIYAWTLNNIRTYSTDARFSWASTARRGNNGCCFVACTVTAAMDSINSHTDNNPASRVWNTPAGSIVEVNHKFGSFHPNGCHMAFADGSVRFVETGLDITAHRLLGQRNDGNAAGRLP